MADEVIAGLFARPGRMLLTVVGMAIGLGALVATLGLASTAGNRVLGQFDALAATEVVVSARFASTSQQADLLPWDAPARLMRLNGVVAAGNKSAVDVGDSLVSTSPIFDPQRQSDFKLAVQAVSPTLFTAVRAQLRSGRFPDEGHSTRRERVAVLGPAAADRLGIARVEQLPSIRIGDNVFLVIGILESTARQPDLLGAVIIPEGTARSEYRLRSPQSVVVETAVGATTLIAQQAPLALRPDDPRAVQVASPPEPQRVRDAVENDLSVLFLVLGLVSLTVGAIGIANVTLISVIERTGEIGLRRALGASRAHIATQFLCESGMMGFAGGILGGSVGTLVVVAASAYLGWTPVLNAGVPLAAPFLGGVTGLVSGLYPAMRAARLEPVEALRGAA
ncbi:MAG: ABC transporter permease [Dehalococcoidia bacterium]